MEICAEVDYVICGNKLIRSSAIRQSTNSLICNVVTVPFFVLLYHSKLTLYTECCSELLDSDTCTWLQALSKILSGYEKKQVCTLLKLL